MAFAKKSAKPKFEPVYGTEFWTEDVRLQFVNLSEPDAGSTYSRNKFCVTALIEQTDEAGLAVITEGICSVAEVDDIDDVEKHPLLDKDGNIRDGDNHPEYEGYAGCYFFTPVANEDNQPQCLALPEDGDPEKVYEVDPSEIYAGCYARLLLLPWIYEEGKVTFILRAVVKTADGERFKTAQAQSAKSSFISKWAKPAAAGASKGIAKKAVPVEEEEETVAAAPKKGRGRPKAAPVEAAAEEETEETQEEEAAPVRRSGGLGGLKGAKKQVYVKTNKVNAAGGRMNPPEEEEEEETPAPAPVKKGLGKAKGLSARL